jgi:hypothetical protein
MFARARPLNAPRWHKNEGVAAVAAAGAVS